MATKILKTEWKFSIDPSDNNYTFSYPSKAEMLQGIKAFIHENTNYTNRILEFSKITFVFDDEDGSLTRHEEALTADEL